MSVERQVYLTYGVYRDEPPDWGDMVLDAHCLELEPLGASRRCIIGVVRMVLDDGVIDLDDTAADMRHEFRSAPAVVRAAVQASGEVRCHRLVEVYV